ncbi:MAG: PepSY domain-containing protein [archaeon]
MLEDIKERLEVAKEKKIEGKFVSAFYMGELSNIEWQIDFFDGKKIYSLLPNGDIKEDTLFGDEELKELDLDEIKVDLLHAEQAVEKIRDEKYPHIEADKVIVILNKTDQTMWNITWLTKDFKIFNVKIDADSGKVLKEKCESVLKFKS